MEEVIPATVSTSHRRLAHIIYLSIQKKKAEVNKYEYNYKYKYECIVFISIYDKRFFLNIWNIIVFYLVHE